jgi:hypothetical protein
MGLKILCSGHLIRYPVGGFSWHHLQYLLGFRQLGHEVAYFEHFGWDQSCYDPARGVMTNDPSYGLTYWIDLLETHGLDIPYCYIAADGECHSLSREGLAQICREADVYFNLSNINWIPELAECRKRALIDTDPVFTQIKAHGLGGPFSDYAARFTYGENIGRTGCSMPDGGVQWLPTRQPVVLSCWATTPPPAQGSLTTVMNWSAYGDHEYQGQVYGQKNREFERYWNLPKDVDGALSIAINAPGEIRQRLDDHGWGVIDPLSVTLKPSDYQAFIAESKAEFSVAKHGYVVTNSGWFSDRSCGYLASGRPVILQDTGFSEFLPTGDGLLAYSDYDGARQAIESVLRDPESHGRAARGIIEEFFDSDKVLGSMLEKVI